MKRTDGQGNGPRLILASASPRRSELLEQIGIPFRVLPAHIDEDAARHEAAIDHTDPVALARTLALEKARVIRARLGGAKDDASVNETEWVLGADTVVACAGMILEKPADRDEAREMLCTLSGRTHSVVTGVAVVTNDGREVIRHAETFVTFSSLSAQETEWYLDTGEFSGVAGAYRIQGTCARFITSVQGSYSNVVGLPLHLVYSILTEHNWPGLGQDIPSAF